MFIVTFCANRGKTGLYERVRVEWAEWVECTKQDDGQVHVKCFHEGLELADDAPVYVVDSSKSGGWEHFYIRHAKTGQVFIPSGFK